jgi:hypothetical protein
MPERRDLCSFVRGHGRRLAASHTEHMNIANPRRPIRRYHLVRMSGIFTADVSD